MTLEKLSKRSAFLRSISLVLIFIYKLVLVKTNSEKASTACVPIKWSWAIRVLDKLEEQAEKAKKINFYVLG